MSEVEENMREKGLTFLIILYRRHTLEISGEKICLKASYLQDKLNLLDPVLINPITYNLCTWTLKRERWTM